MGLGFGLGLGLGLGLGFGLGLGLGLGCGLGLGLEGASHLLNEGAARLAERVADDVDGGLEGGGEVQRGTKVKVLKVRVLTLRW